LLYHTSFIPIVRLFLNTDFDYRLLHLLDLDIGLTASVTSQQGMLAPLRHLIPPLVCLILCTVVFPHHSWYWPLYVAILSLKERVSIHRNHSSHTLSCSWSFWCFQADLSAKYWKQTTYSAVVTSTKWTDNFFLTRIEFIAFLFLIPFLVVVLCEAHYSFCSYIKYVLCIAIAEGLLWKFLQMNFTFWDFR
jgi:hypothetical protein